MAGGTDPKARPTGGTILFVYQRLRDQSERHIESIHRTLFQELARPIDERGQVLGPLRWMDREEVAREAEEFYNPRTGKLQLVVG